MANTKITAANIDSTSTGFTLADLTVDTTTLVVDATNNRVGIGTASPASTLEVNNTSAGDTVATFEGDYGAGGDVQLVRYERGGGAVYGAISYKDATTDMEFGNISSHALSFITANTRRLTIDSNGDIGINTSSPIDGSKLDVVDSDDMTMRVRSTGSSSAAIRFQNSTTGTTTNDGLFVGIGTDETGYVWHYDNNPLAFATNNTERMRIDSSGKLLIGDSASHVDDLLQIETPASGGGHGIQIRRNDSNTDQGIGRIMFGNNTDTDLATIQVTTDGSSDNARIGFFTQPNGGSSTERMRIDSSGRVGIGTSSPETFLHIKTTSPTISMTDTNSFSDTNDRFQLRANADVGMFQWYDDSASSTTTLMEINPSGQVLVRPLGVSTPSFAFIGDSNTGITRPTGDTLQFVCGGSEKARITSSGNLCVGVTAATTSTGVAGTFRSDAASDPSIDLAKISGNTSSANIFIRFHASSGGTAMGGIAGNGGGNAQFIAISDERLKENINPLSGSLDKVLALNPVSYDWKKNGEHIEAGFVAQEVEEILPEYVTTEENEEQIKGLTGGMSAGYIAVLTKAIQEQQTIIDDLKSRIETLEG